jgi:hypothetical protein
MIVSSSKLAPVATPDDDHSYPTLEVIGSDFDLVAQAT